MTPRRVALRAAPGTTDADHVRLAAALGPFTRTRVVVSYYDHPRLAELYPGWKLRHIKATKALVNGGMRDKAGATAAPEVLLSNLPFPVRPSDRESSMFAFED